MDDVCTVAVGWARRYLDTGSSIVSEPPLLLNMETASLDVSRGTISSDTSITITAANAYFRGEVTVTAPSVRWPAWLIRRCRRHHAGFTWESSSTDLTVVFFDQFCYPPPQ